MLQVVVFKLKQEVYEVGARYIYVRIWKLENYILSQYTTVLG